MEQWLKDIAIGEENIKLLEVFFFFFFFFFFFCFSFFHFPIEYISEFPFLFYLLNFLGSDWERIASNEL